MSLVPIERLLYGIRQVETGGRQDAYTTVNSIGAHGAYQVMRENIGPWTQELFGRAYTPAEFLAAPRAQDALAKFRLSRDMKKYGSWEAAASVWFSGQPNWNSSASDGGNTVSQYVAKVRKAMTGGGTVTGGGQPSAPAMPSLGRSVYTAQQAGYEAETRTNAYGAPVNPYKLPGWIASQNAGEASTGTAQAGLVDDVLGGDVVPWDGVSTVVLSTLFVLGGLGLVVVGLVSAVSPTVKAAADTAASVTPAGAVKGAP